MHRNDITVSSRHPSRNKHPVGRRTALRIIASNAQLFLESEIRGGVEQHFSGLLLAFGFALSPKPVTLGM